MLRHFLASVVYQVMSPDVLSDNGFRLVDGDPWVMVPGMKNEGRSLGGQLGTARRWGDDDRARQVEREIADKRVAAMDGHQRAAMIAALRAADEDDE